MNGCSMHALRAEALRKRVDEAGKGHGASYEKERGVRRHPSIMLPPLRPLHEHVLVLRVPHH